MDHSSSKQPMSSVVPMRFYANWDVDRTSSSSIQRTLSMNFARLALAKTLTTESNLVIAVRLQGHRRTLRSNDINISGSQLDIALDISFTIQYCHFIKRKSNVLQILIQRRKKYKNRQIPGFKTLAMGQLNLDEILQQGGSREVTVWDTTYLSKSGPNVKELHAGTIFITNCYSQVLDVGDQYVSKWNKSSSTKTHGDHNMSLLSEEDNDDYSSQDDTDFDDFHRATGRRNDTTPRVNGRNRKRQQINNRQTRKNIKQKNIKQKVVALLRRFRIPDDDDNTAAAGSTSSSRVMPPTEEELQEIFEELENISDSGPELEPDKMSIVSNPRPGLRPFFGSKTDILPAIEDQVPSDVDSMPDSEEQEMSSEDNLKESGFWIQQIPEGSGSHPYDFGNAIEGPLQKDGIPLSARERLMKHSSTANSILYATGQAESSTRQSSATGSRTTKKDSNVVLLDLISQSEGQSIPSSSFVVPLNMWICSSSDLPWLSRLDFNNFANVRLFDCPSQGDVRAVMQTIVGRIQKFCNSNSASPPATRLGLLGGDRLVSHVLRAYVDLLQNKTCQEWLGYLRFSMVVPPSSATGRLLAQITDGGYSEALWKALARITACFDPLGPNAAIPPADYQEIDACLSSVTGEQISENQLRSSNLCIGEVMLQLESDCTDERNGSQMFIPFLSELHLGNLDETSSPLYYMKNSLDDSINATVQPSSSTPANPLPASHSQTFPTFSAITSNLSPPVSPQTHKSTEGRELYVEYWTCTANSSSASHLSGDPYTSAGSHKSPASNISAGTTTKFSMKANVRTLSVAREPTTSLLCILFVKDKKKADKVLQKLGRKTKQRSSTAFSNSHSRIVSGVSRMVCSGAANGSSTKNQAFLDVSIDGNRWKRIRYFQISHQWQTHVRLFPLVFPLVSSLPTLSGK